MTGIEYASWAVISLGVGTSWGFLIKFVFDTYKEFRNGTHYTQDCV